MLAHPKVVFSLNSELDKETIYWFLSRLPWNKKVIIRANPKLGAYLRAGKNMKTSVNAYVDYFYKTHKKELKSVVKKFQKAWNPINDEVMERLSEIMEKEWKIQRINAYLTLNPICPRFLRSKSFQVTYNRSLGMMKSIVLHEITHFLYFDKWREVFPKDKQRTFERPHVVWVLSEIVVAPIDNDPRLRRYMDVYSRSYNQFYKIRTKYKGKKASVMGYFERLYQDMILNRGTQFSDFLREARKRIYIMRKSFRNV